MAIVRNGSLHIKKVASYKQMCHTFVKTCLEMFFYTNVDVVSPAHPFERTLIGINEDNGMLKLR